MVSAVGPNGCGKSSIFDGMLFLTQASFAFGRARTSATKCTHCDVGASKLRIETSKLISHDGDFHKGSTPNRDNGSREYDLVSFPEVPYRYNSNLSVRESKDSRN